MITCDFIAKFTNRNIVRLITKEALDLEQIIEEMILHSFSISRSPNRKSILYDLPFKKPDSARYGHGKALI